MPKTVALLRDFINVYFIKTQIWVSINCAALAGAAQLSFEGKLNPPYCFALFWVTMAGYHFFHIKGFKKVKELFSQSSFIFLLLSIVSLSALFMQYGDFLSTQKWVYFIVLSVLSALYYIPVISVGVRQIPYLKLFYIALIWSLWINLWALEQFVMTNFFSVFFFVAAITIPFDIRDIALADITLPKKLGVSKAKKLSIIFLWIATLLALYSTGLTSKNSLMSFVLTLFLSYILWKVDTFSNRKNNDFYINFFIEGMPLALLLIFMNG